jgi:transposase-like protein
MKPKLGFQNFQSAAATISGIEVMHMLHKQQAGKMSPNDEAAFIYHVMRAI